MVLTLLVVQTKPFSSFTLSIKNTRRIRRQAEQNICSSIQCKHGICDPNASVLGVCKCEEGWAGPLCNYQCRKQCGPHGTCSLFGNIENCKCDLGFSGEFCDKAVERAVLPQPEALAFRQSNSIIFRQPENSSVVFDKKVCFPGFVCSHGVCEYGHNNDGALTVRCNCEQDWIGTFCHVPCLRRCRNGGRCFRERADGNEFCICPFNYSGSLCEIKKPDNRAFAFTG